MVPADDYLIEHARSMAAASHGGPAKRTRWPFSAGRGLMSRRDPSEAAMKAMMDSER